MSSTKVKVFKQMGFTQNSNLHSFILSLSILHLLQFNLTLSSKIIVGLKLPNVLALFTIIVFVRVLLSENLLTGLKIINIE